MIRTIGLYQPFCTLMLHGKLETRWIKKDKKPPFPLGRYLFYSTQKPATNFQMFDWCGAETALKIELMLLNDKTRNLNGFAIAYGELVDVRPMTKEDEPLAFVKFVGEREDKIQWILEFKNIETITPKPFTEGKQGIGILKQEI